MVTKLIPDQDFAVSLAPQMNILTNGGFEIWQRGVSFSSPANDAYTADKWQVSKNSTPTFTVTRESAGANVDAGSYSMKLDITVVGGSTSLYIRHVFEQATDYRNKTVTFSARVKSNSNKCRLEIFDGVTETFSSPHSGGGAFETLSVTVTLGAGGLITAGIGFTGAGFGPVVSTSYFDSAMIVVGSQPIAYIPMHPADDIARCMRYYETGHFVSFVPIFHQNPGVGNQIETTISWKVRKSAVPTVTVTGFGCTLLHLPTTGNSISGDSANWPTTGATSVISVNECRVQNTRNSDQTTFPILEPSFDWSAEVA